MTTPRPSSARNADGYLKTLGQLMRARLTVLQYGRLLAATSKAVNRG